MDKHRKSTFNDGVMLGIAQATVLGGPIFAVTAFFCPTKTTTIECIIFAILYFVIGMIMWSKMGFRLYFNRTYFERSDQ